MVKYSSSHTDAVFRALADPTRRAILRSLAIKEHTVNELAEPYQMSLAAVSKHIKVLESAKLVRRQIQGRMHICRLNPEPLAIVREWMQFYEKFWTRSLDALEDALAKSGQGDSQTEAASKRFQPPSKPSES